VSDSLFVGLTLTLLIGAIFFAEFSYSTTSRDIILTAIKDTGCATHIEMPEPRQVKDDYNMNSLGGE